MSWKIPNAKPCVYSKVVIHTSPPYKWFINPWAISTPVHTYRATIEHSYRKLKLYRCYRGRVVDDSEDGASLEMSRGTKIKLWEYTSNLFNVIFHTFIIYNTIRKKLSRLGAAIVSALLTAPRLFDA